MAGRDRFSDQPGAAGVDDTGGTDNAGTVTGPDPAAGADSDAEDVSRGAQTPGSDTLDADAGTTDAGDAHADGNAPDTVTADVAETVVGPGPGRPRGTVVSRETHCRATGSCPAWCLRAAERVR